MNRPNPAPGMLAVAAFAAITILALTPRGVPGQQVVPPAPAPDQPRIVAPGPATTIEMRRTGRVTTQVNPLLPGAKLVVPMQGVAVVNADQLARQIMEQLRPAFERELRLLTSAAGPSPSQRREIAIEAGRFLRWNVGAAMGRVPAQQTVQIRNLLNDPNLTVRNYLLIAAKEKLSQSQYALYQAELDRKEADRKEVGVLNIVANLDGKLHLSSKQREQLCESIRKYWDDRECPVLESSAVYDLYAPLLSDATILPFLDERQEKIWRALPKYHLGPMRVSNPVNPVLALEFEDKDRDEDVMVAFAEEAKK